MSQMTKEEEREYYKTFVSPIHNLTASERLILERSANNSHHTPLHITSKKQIGGVTISSVYPTKHIHIFNYRKLWVEEAGQFSMNFATEMGLIVNGKKYKLVGDEWIVA